MNARSIPSAAPRGLVPLVLATLLVSCGGDGELQAGAPSVDSTYPIEPGADSMAVVAGADTPAPTMPASPAAERPTTTNPTTRPAAESPTSRPAVGTAGGSEASTPQPAPLQEVEEILRATARRYEGVRSLQADFQQRLTNTLLGRTTESAGTLFQRQPDRFLMRFSQPAGDVIVSDGQYFWVYYPSADAKQVIRSNRGAGGLDLRSQFVGDIVERFEATSHGAETVRGRTTHAMTLTPRQPVGYVRLKVWIDAEDHLVRRFELTEENGNVRRFELTDLRVNPTLSDDLFRFEPPAGAVVVSR